MSKNEVRGIINELKSQVFILSGTVALMWILEFFDLMVFRGKLNYFGIIPGSFIGLRGILFAPFLHGDFLHLAANTIPFVTLGWLIMLRETSDFFIVSAISMLVSGLGVWLFAPPNSIHIGASGVVFGYLGYLIFRGYFQRSPGSIFLSLIVGLIYGSMIWGVLPTELGISWQGHLFGFIGGAIAARLLSRKKI
ncbi:rhomboid family intramembrane serine protease [[Phormidium ambiguum] IAM M-71]|uniref:Rhomboid family intramembrane serine protease n=1 Tax=[Phormidium ambiguum] IAM M-71 TaxID=454136 RepID=A0A1U7ISQ2_9CYAN|nr:rhomboid family intramembrane serine protease [Phormidium ambiguum]OKH40478.1 rhomboid family intramembrane serine protease [Phormidium ambiguum IAM M-71]